MDKRFRLLFSLLILLNVVVGGFGFVRLFSWKSLLGVDRFFFVFVSILFVFSVFMAYLFSKLDNVSIKVEPVKKVDSELEELRKESDKVPPHVPVDTSFLRSPEPKPVPPVVRALTEDVSMYEKRNIIKPPTTQEDKAQGNGEYEGIF